MLVRVLQCWVDESLAGGDSEQQKCVCEVFDCLQIRALFWELEL